MVYLIRFFIEYPFESLPQPRKVADHGTKFFQPGGIARFGNEQLKVTAIIVFLVHVVEKTPPMALPVQFRIMLETKLYRTAEYFQGDYVAVGFGDYPAVYAPWFGPVGCPVVLSSLGDGLNLFRREKARKEGIIPYYPSGCKVMSLPTFDESGVVEGSGGIDHIHVNIIMLR